jgi:lipoate-protein ligase A
MRENIGKASFKVPKGKLITAKVVYGSEIKRVELTGDFFIHPEEGLSVIESSIEGMPSNAPEEDVAAEVQSAMDANMVQAIGIDASSVAKVVKKAMA